MRLAWRVSYSTRYVPLGTETPHTLIPAAQIVYFGRAIPWIIVDATPYFRKWKLQPNKIPTPGEQWACTKQVLFSHFTVELPVIWLFHPMAEFFGMATWQVPFPAWSAIAPQVFFFFVFEDMFHYFGASSASTKPQFGI